MSVERILNFIDGKLCEPRGGKYLPVYEPATGLPYAEAPDSDHEDVSLAVAAAKRAGAAWAARPAAERGRFLRAISDGIERELDSLARAESVDAGKPIALARSLDIPRAAQNFAFFADAITQAPSEAYLLDGTALGYTLRAPLGVVGCISPWNLPLYLLSWKIAPALAAGCTVVAKPSEITPMTAFRLARICEQVGLPPGVLNLVHGLGTKAGAAIAAHPEVRGVSFTGSTRVGAELARVTAPIFKKLSLEMGGKNATLVFADCDFDATVQGVARAAFTNQGQICLCGSRIFVERSIYERFKTALVEKVRALKQGDPLEGGTEQGALSSREHFDKVMGYLETAKQEGGKFLIGGRAFAASGRCQGGWFVEPTLIEGLAPECRVNQDEIFGPVATLIPFDTEEEALKGANGTRYGLAASIWTQNVTRAHRVAASIEAGVVWVNCWLVRDLRTPFGGMKDSGVGREGGLEALHFFTEPKSVCVRLQ